MYGIATIKYGNHVFDADSTRYSGSCDCYCISTADVAVWTRARVRCMFVLLVLLQPPVSGVPHRSHPACGAIYKGIGMNDSARIDLVIQAADETNLTIDYLEWLTRGLSRKACLKVIGNASSMPAYMKSSDNPYVSRKAIAPSTDTRC